MRVIGFSAIIVMAFTIACSEPEIKANLTATATTKPTETPPSTPTPTEAENLIVRIGGQIDDKVQEQSSSCNVDRNIDATITMFSSRSINYLRAYLKIPELSTSDIRYAIDYLESQRGGHERLCNQERDRIVPEVKNVSDIIKHYEMFDESLSEDKACEAAERAQALSSTLSRENINYARGFFDALWFDRDDLLQLVAHFESEAGRYAALCDKKK